MIRTSYGEALPENGHHTGRKEPYILYFQLFNDMDTVPPYGILTQTSGISTKKSSGSRTALYPPVTRGYRPASKYGRLIARHLFILHLVPMLYSIQVRNLDGNVVRPFPLFAHPHTFLSYPSSTPLS